MSGFLVQQVSPETPIPLFLGWDNKTLPRSEREPMPLEEAQDLADTWNLCFRDWCRVRIVRAKG